MESKIKLFGHPIHPQLIVFPLGLFSTAAIFDVLYLIAGNAVLPIVSFYMIAAGIIGGLVAAIFGFIDWLALPGKTRAKSIGGWHGIGNVVIVVIFLISWLLRRNKSNFIPNSRALTLSFVGLGLALITGWIGGELVYRLGVAVDPDANLNASSSLTETASVVEVKRTR